MIPPRTADRDDSWNGGPVGTSDDTGPEFGWSVAGLVALLGICLLVAVAVAGAAGGPDGAVYQADDPDGANETDENESSTPPEIGPAAKVDATTVELELHDDVGVDPASVERTDFGISPRHVENVTVRERGTNASVLVHMPRPTDSDHVTLEVRANSSFADVDGNVLNLTDPVTRRVTGMDGVPPQIQGFEVTNDGHDAVVVEFFANEDLADVNAVLFGTETVRVGRSAFESPAGSARYRASVVPPGDGSWTAALVNVSDAAGNVLAPRLRETTEVYNDPPDAVAGIDFGASEARTFTFDAGRSSDPQGIANYTWSFGTGETATGERVTHTFAPGNYSVTLTATDVYGNEGTDRLVLNLTRGANGSDVGVGAADLSKLDDPFVTVGRSEASDAGSAMVDVAGATGDEPVRVGAGVEPVAVGETFRVEQVDLAFARDGSYSFAVSTDAGDAASDLAGAHDVRLIGSMTIVHTFPSDVVDEATFTVSLDRSDVEDMAPDLEDVALYRYGNGSWSALETTVVHRGTDRYHLGATAPGFSRFALAAEQESEATPTPTPTPDPDGEGDNGTETPAGDGNETSSDDEPDAFVVTDVELNRTQVPPGEAVLVTAPVENPGDALVAVEAGLSINDTVVSTQTLTIPPGQNRTAGFEHTFEDPGTYPVAVNGTAGPNVTVGDAGGGGPFGIFGYLGFLPLGLIEFLLTYVGGVLGAGYMLLKGAAIFLGY